MNHWILVVMSSPSANLGGDLEVMCNHDFGPAVLEIRSKIIYAHRVLVPHEREKFRALQRHLVIALIVFGVIA